MADVSITDPGIEAAGITPEDKQQDGIKAPVAPKATPITPDSPADKSKPVQTTDDNDGTGSILIGYNPSSDAGTATKLTQTTTSSSSSTESSILIGYNPSQDPGSKPTTQPSEQLITPPQQPKPPHSSLPDPFFQLHPPTGITTRPIPIPSFPPLTPPSSPLTDSFTSALLLRIGNLETQLTLTSDENKVLKHQLSKGFWNNEESWKADFEVLKGKIHGNCKEIRERREKEVADRGEAELEIAGLKGVLAAVEVERDVLKAEVGELKGRVGELEEELGCGFEEEGVLKAIDKGKKIEEELRVLATEYQARMQKYWEKAGEEVMGMAGPSKKGGEETDDSEKEEWWSACGD